MECKQLFECAFIDIDGHKLYQIPTDIKKIFMNEIDRIYGLRIWGNNSYRFCANDMPHLQSLHFFYTMYDVNKKTLRLIILYSNNFFKYNTMDFLITKSKRTRCNTKWLIDDKLFKYACQINNVKIPMKESNYKEREYIEKMIRN